MNRHSLSTEFMHALSPLLYPPMYITNVTVYKLLRAYQFPPIEVQSLLQALTPLLHSSLAPATPAKPSTKLQ